MMQTKLITTEFQQVMAFQGNEKYLLEDMGKYIDKILEQQDDKFVPVSIQVATEFDTKESGYESNLRASCLIHEFKMENVTYFKELCKTFVGSVVAKISKMETESKKQISTVCVEIVKKGNSNLDSKCFGKYYHLKNDEKCLGWTANEVSIDGIDKKLRF